VLEANGRMMGKSFLNQHMPVETPHFPDTEDTDAAKRLRVNIQDFSLSDIRSQPAVSCALETKNGDPPGFRQLSDKVQEQKKNKYVFLYF